MAKRLPIQTAILVILVFTLVGCGSSQESPQLLRIATTTSVENSGLLPAILPRFEAQYNAQVDVIAVGTGQALALGESGDVDAVLVHAPELEEEFVRAGYGAKRFAVMYNDFVIAGPKDDPAGVGAEPDAAAALTRIFALQSPFVSRGDQSGTHFRENQLWDAAGMSPPEGQDWYYSIGQGMGSTLIFANEQRAYLLTDRGTFLAQHENIPNLTILFGGPSPLENPDPLLKNIYSVIPVNPERYPHVDHELAAEFAAWITSLETQLVIGQFGVERFGVPLFYPSSLDWQNQSVPSIKDSTDPAENRLAGVGVVTKVHQILSSLDPKLWEIAGMTLRVSGTALVLACLIGIPLGVVVGLGAFRGKRVVQVLLYTGMGFPPVVIGLVTFLLLSNNGLLGFLGWLFTPQGMTLAQTILAVPLTAGLTMTAIGDVSPKLIIQIRSLGANQWQERWTVFTQARRGVVAAALAALGRIISEVGAAMLVGGNIDGKTRVLSTAIVLETRQGSFDLALALGLILLGIALLANILMIQLGGRWQQ